MKPYSEVQLFRRCLNRLQAATQTVRQRVRETVQQTVRSYSSTQKLRWGDYFQPIVDQGSRGIEQFKQLVQSDRLGLNQTFDTENEANLHHLINNFHSKIQYSFGYGSGVFEQAGYGPSTSKPQIDVVHVVDSTRRFHTINLEQFPQHYSFLKLFGIRSIEKFQHFGAGVYFNPYVSMKDHDNNANMIKYGVANIDQTLIDICEWSNLYLAGRLQKPVKFLKQDDNLLQNLNQYNLRSATMLSLLLTKTSTVYEQQLYETISLISYMGDLRMFIGGENPNKVKNIVSKQFGKFQKLYGPIISSLIEAQMIEPSTMDSRLMGATGSQSISTETEATNRQFHLHLDVLKKSQIINELPLQFRRKLYLRYREVYPQQFLEDRSAQAVVKGSDKSLNQFTSSQPFVQAIAKDKHLITKLVQTIQHTVGYPAFTQTVKGLITAGLVKSVKYAWEKKMKSLYRTV